MTAKQRRFERNVLAALANLQAKIDVLCKAAGIDPETLADLDMLETVQAETDESESEAELPELVSTPDPEPVPEPTPVAVQPTEKPKATGKPKAS